MNLIELAEILATGKPVKNIIAAGGKEEK